MYIIDIYRVEELLDHQELIAIWGEGEMRGGTTGDARE